MAELVYAFDLKSNEETRTGSSPVSATTILIKIPCFSSSTRENTTLRWYFWLGYRGLLLFFGRFFGWSFATDWEPWQDGAGDTCDNNNVNADAGRTEAK